MNFPSPTSRAASTSRGERSSLALAGALLLLGGVLVAQESGQVAPSGEHARPTACIVHRTDGTLIRGQAVPELPAPGGFLVVRTDRGELRLGAEEIGSVRRLAEVRKDYLAWQRELPESPLRRHQLASWCARQGLWEEMQEQLDPILAENPGDPLATALLRSADLEALVPLPEGDWKAAANQALTLGARSLSKPTQRRLVELRFESLSPDLYEPVLGAAVTSKNAQQRAFAVGALARLDPDEGLKRAIERSLLDTNQEVRSSARQALAQDKDPGIVFPLLRGLRSKHPQVRLNAIDALAELQDPRAVRDLIARVTLDGGPAPRSYFSNTRQISYVSDYDVEVAQAAAIADPVINVLQEGVVLDVTVIGTHGERDYYVERRRALGALKDITKKDLGADPKAWDEWWQKNEETVLAAFYERKGITPPERNG